MKIIIYGCRCYYPFWWPFENLKLWTLWLIFICPAGGIGLPSSMGNLRIDFCSIWPCAHFLEYLVFSNFKAYLNWLLENKIWEYLSSLISLFRFYYKQLSFQKKLENLKLVNHLFTYCSLFVYWLGSILEIEWLFAQYLTCGSGLAKKWPEIWYFYPRNRICGPGRHGLGPHSKLRCEGTCSNSKFSTS